MKTKAFKKLVFTFKHFQRKNYSSFSSMKKEVRVGVLSVSTLLAASNGALASRADSLDIVRQQSAENDLSEVVVSGRAAVSLEESANKVEIITREDIARANVQTVNDLLKLCTSLDVRQRGAFGVQTDIGIGGGTFDQISILINGISINNPQTGHLTADFPVALSDIERIEVYDGTSARCFGSQALNGAINIITHISKQSESAAHLAAGSYGTLLTELSGNLSNSAVEQRISAGYLRSDGATDNSHFQRLRAFYQGQFSPSNISMNWQAGYSYQRYGANTFYSAKFPNQWERNNRIFTSLQAHTLKGPIKVQGSFTWLRSYDHFQLTRFSTDGENFHRNDVLTANLNLYSHWALGRTAVGGEFRSESIVSTNLGVPLDSSQWKSIEGHSDRYYYKGDHRNNLNFFLEHLVRIGKLSLSAGSMINITDNANASANAVTNSGADFSYRPNRKLKATLSWNQSMRLPTYTDLYYQSPTQLGNQDLKPERASTFKATLDATPSECFSLSLQALYRKGTDMIDWVMYSPTDKYHSTQFNLDNIEYVFQSKLSFSQLLGEDCPLQSIETSYKYNNQWRRDDLPIFKSNYALEYLRHKAVVILNHKIVPYVDASWQYVWQQRMGNYLVTEPDNNTHLVNYSPYSLVNLKITYHQPHFDLYTSLDNLLNHSYRDFGSIPQPRFTFLIGLKYKLK